MIRFRPLVPEHDRTEFYSGVASLDIYLRTTAGQAVRKHLNAVVVAVDVARPRDILGYYSICSIELSGASLPVAMRRAGLPAHMIGAILIGRLAVDERHQGMGLGRRLLVNALRRATAVAILAGSACVIVDALDESAAAFYTHCGFVRFAGTRRLGIAMADIFESFVG